MSTGRGRRVPGQAHGRAHQTDERPFGDDGGDDWGANLLASSAAGDGDVSIHGGADTINLYLAAGLVDELRLHIVPFTLAPECGCSKVSRR